MGARAVPGGWGLHFDSQSSFGFPNMNVYNLPESKAVVQSNRPDIALRRIRPCKALQVAPVTQDAAQDFRLLVHDLGSRPHHFPKTQKPLKPGHSQIP